MSTVPEDVGDAVAHLWRVWRPRWVHTDLDAWRQQADFIRDIAELAYQIRRSGAIPADARDSVGAWESFRLAAAIDKALMHTHPRLRAGGADRAMARLTRRWIDHRRLNQPVDGIPLVVVWAGAVALHGDDLANVFASTRVISSTEFEQLDIVRPRLVDRLAPRRSASMPIVVGCVPVLDDPDDLQFGFVGPSYFETTVRDPDPTIARAAALLAVLDDADIDIAVCPEATLTQDGLAAWQAAIQDPVAQARTTRLRWIVAGTGPIDPCDPPPRNQAIVLSRHSGERLFEQSKRHMFKLNEHRIDQWRLTSTFKGAPASILSEYITLGAKWTVIDDDALLVAVAICEDLERSDDVGNALLALRPNILLSPILDVEVTEGGWPDQSARRWMNVAGTKSVVSNSLVIARRRDCTNPASSLFQDGSLPPHFSDDIYPGPSTLGYSEHFADVIRFEI